jgi:3-oxoacid CoA-transferase subunit B
MRRGLTRQEVARRAAQELREGMYVNLGMGIPTLVTGFVPAGMTVFLQSEHGILGMGPPPPPGRADPDFVDASRTPVTVIPGAALFSSAESFAMIRGRHLDMTILGAYQVSARGDLANWMIPERGVGSIGGAMDLVYGARRVVVTMEHVTKDGKPRVVDRCSYPLTGRQCVDLIVTDLAVIEVGDDGLVLKEVAPGATPQEVQAKTGADLAVSAELREIRV